MLKNNVDIPNTAYKLVFLYLLYRMILDSVYVIWVSPIFGYSGFVLDIDIKKVVLSYFYTLFFAAIIPKNEKKVSRFVLQLHFIVIIIPMFSVYAMANLSSTFMVMICVAFLFQIVLIRWLPLIRVVKIKGAKLIIIVTMTLLTVVTYLYLFRTQGINLSALNLSGIYDIRSEQNISGVMGYLVTWQYRIINPFLLVISFLNKNIKLAFVAMTMQVVLYLMFPHKEVFLAVGLIFMVLFIMRFSLKFDVVLLSFISIAVFITTMAYEWWGHLMAFAIIPVRWLFVPAIIKFQHYDFFSVNEKLYFSEGKIGQLLGIEYPYDVASGFLISGGSANANTGYLAYAYDNAGFIGIILMSLIFVFILLVVDSLVKKENQKGIFALIVYPMIILNDGDLLTLLLTGGLALLLATLFVYSNIDGKKLKGKCHEKETNAGLRL